MAILLARQLRLGSQELWRHHMLEELQRRNYSAITTRNYLRVVADFAKHFGKSPDKLGLNELRTYQAYLLRERKLTPGTVINQVAARRFFFVKTLKRHQFRDFLPYPQDQRRLPTVLSLEEVSRLINAAGTLFRTDAADDALWHRHALTGISLAAGHWHCDCEFDTQALESSTWTRGLRNRAYSN